MNHPGKQALDDIAQRLDGVTDGPWKHTSYMSGTQNVEYPGEAGVSTVNDVSDADGNRLVYETSHQPARFLNVSHRPRDRAHDFDRERYATGKYIEAISPDKMREILAYVADLETRKS